MKKQTPRILMILATLGLLSLFVWPMWRITLYAPQYPDGVTMLIWIDKIGGNEPGVLQNINILNHYVGMKYIEPESIPELTYFPYIVAGLAVLCFLAALLNRRWGYWGWAILYTVICAIGIYDFYQWEYEYGHNLSDTAPIKIPGASFQPPLLGKKDILNFVAVSMPHTSGFLAGAAIFLGFLAGWLRKPTPVKVGGSAAVAGLLLLGSMSLSSCAVEPVPIRYGSDQCDFCKMAIVDRHFGAEAVSKKGKIFRFDATECMIGFLETRHDDDFAWLMAGDYATPGSLVDARECTFLISEALPSPMGANLSAFADRSEAEAMQAERGGVLFQWAELGQQIANRDGPGLD